MVLVGLRLNTHFHLCGFAIHETSGDMVWLRSGDEKNKSIFSILKKMCVLKIPERNII